MHTFQNENARAIFDFQAFNYKIIEEYHNHEGFKDSCYYFYVTFLNKSSAPNFQIKLDPGP